MQDGNQTLATPMDFRQLGNTYRTPMSIQTLCQLDDLPGGIEFLYFGQRLDDLLDAGPAFPHDGPITRAGFS